MEKTVIYSSSNKHHITVRFLIPRKQLKHNKAVSMFSRFKLSCLRLNNIINSRAPLIRKYTTDRVKGSPFHAENVVLYKYTPSKWETLLVQALSSIIFVYAVAFSSTYMTIFNKNIVVPEETAEELQKRMDYLEKLEESFSNKKINYPSYLLKKTIHTNNEAYRKGLHDIFCLVVAAIGCTGAYYVRKFPKKIVVEVAKMDNKLVMKTYDNKNIIELPPNTFKVLTQDKLALKRHETCIVFAYGSEENKRLLEKKLFSFKHMYLLKIDGAEYPNDWSTFQFYINKK